MSLPDVTITLGSDRPIRLLGRSLTVEETRDLARELDAAAELVDRRASHDLADRVGMPREKSR